MSEAVSRPRYVDRPWRRRLIAVAIAIGLHVVIIWLAWPTVDQWMNRSKAMLRTGPVTETDVQRAIDASPLFAGMINTAPTAGDVLASEDVTSQGWTTPSLKLEYTMLPHAPQRWLAIAPPVATLSLDHPPAKPAPANR